MIVFVDDIMIYSRSREEHKTHLQIALQTLREHCLYAKLSKCEFWLYEVVFLGHVISVVGIAMDLAKVKIILRWEGPTTAIEIRSFLGLVRYY